ALVALVVYGIGRAYLGHHYGLSTGRGELGYSVLRKYISTMPIAITLALEGLWLVLIAGLVRGILDRSWHAWAIAVCAAGSAVIPVMVGDVTRSTVYLLPAVAIGAAFLVGESDRVKNSLLIVCVVTCVVMPTTSVILNGFTIFYPLPLRLVL